MIVRNRPNCPPSTDRELEQCVAVFKSLLLSVAQWTIRFGSDQILAKKNELAAATAGKKISRLLEATFAASRVKAFRLVQHGLE